MINWNPLIKTLEQIIEKEKMHLSMLMNRNAPKKYVDKSKEMLTHYNQRVSDYRSENNK